VLVNANKAQILKTAFGNLFEGMRKMAIVDGANDVDLFDLADLKVAFNAQDIVSRKADSRINVKDLRPILNLAKAELAREDGGISRKELQLKLLSGRQLTSEI
jgi:phosphoserine phosphatase